MNVQLGEHKHGALRQQLSFDVVISNDSVTLTLHSVARSPLHYNANRSTARFLSLGALQRQVERLAERVRHPRRLLTSTGWSRCWPPYRAAARRQAFYLGSLYGFNRDSRIRYFSFALSPSHSSIPLACVSMHLDESVYWLPRDLFDSLLTALQHEQRA
jgi:hypothetical protein